MAETLTLAPMAGAGIGKQLADALLSDPEFMPAMKAAAMGGIKAYRSFWSKDAGLVTEPDFRIQVQTMALLLAHMEGEPVKRIIHQHLTGPGGPDLGAALRESPELQAALEAELQKAKWKHSGRAEHKRPKKVTEAKAKPAETEL